MALLTIDEVRQALRLDGTENDPIIQSMLDSLPDYLEVTTGSRWEDGTAPGYQLAKQCAKFILQLWYDPGASEAARLSNAVDSMLGTLKLWAPIK
ncbi:head-tail connector protein [Caproicibacterium sp. XB2]|uniref:head-tail connector protein n=1 Tax=Caproicibacterium sp. XB2 TaxID=3388458 RepID=UPI00384E9863